MVKSAYQNSQGEWIYPQMYYQDERPISKKRLLERINSNMYVQAAIHLEPRIGRLIERAKKQRCEYGYNRLEVCRMNGNWKSTALTCSSQNGSINL